MPLRIAHFVQRYPPALGGSEAYFQRLSQYFASAGHDVTVWTTNAADLEAFWTSNAQTVPGGDSVDHGVKVRRFRCEHWPLQRYILKACSFLPGATWKAMMMPCNPVSRHMWKEAGCGKAVDVVHATAFPYAWPIVCARRLARRWGAAFFITPFLHLGRSTRQAYLAPHLLDLLRSADGIFVQTPSERAAVSSIGMPEHKIILQGMGVDPADCTGGEREATRKEWMIDPSQVAIGHLANLSQEKGTIDLLQAVPHLPENCRVVLAGPDMPNFRRFWATYPYMHRIRKLGVLDAKQKRDFFAAIDVFALPSRSDSFGLVLLEAWANGVPSVAYRCGGVADVIRDGEDGRLVDCDTPRSIERLAADLTRLVEDAELRLRLGRAGRSRVATDFRWEDKLRIVEDAYTRARSRDGVPATR